MDSNLLKKAAPVRILLTDCDGVLTDGGVYYAETGEVMKRFNIRDGMGAELLRVRAGIEMGIVTGENSASVRHRAKKLGVEELHQNIQDKKTKLAEIIARRQLGLHEIAYIGDDVNDLEVLAAVGISACPSDAVDEVKAIVDVILTRPGGHGAFREFAELLILAKNDVVNPER